MSLLSRLSILRIADFPIPMCQIVAAGGAEAAPSADCAVCKWLSRASDIDKLADCSPSDRILHIGASETAIGRQAGFTYADVTSA